MKKIAYVSGNSVAAKGYQSFTVNDDLLQKVTEAVVKGEKEARSSGAVKSFEVFHHGFRQNISIGRLFLVPPSVCSKPEDFPVALLYGTVVKLLNLGEETADLIALHTGGEFDEDSDVKEHLTSLKEKAFTNDEGKEVSLVVFAPAWSGIREYVAFQFTDDEPKLLNLLRHLVFACYFNPSVSSGFDALMTTVDTIKLDVTDITPKLTYPALTESPFRAYPDLAKTSSGQKKIFLTVKTADAIAQDQLEPAEMDVFQSLETALGGALSKTKSPEEAAAKEYKKPDVNAEVPRADDGTGPKAAAVKQAGPDAPIAKADYPSICDDCLERYRQYGYGAEVMAGTAAGASIRRCEKCGRNADLFMVKITPKPTRPQGPGMNPKNDVSSDWRDHMGSNKQAADTYVVKQDGQIKFGPVSMEECLGWIMDEQGSGIGINRGGYEIEPAGPQGPTPTRPQGPGMNPKNDVSSDWRDHMSSNKQADTADNPANEKDGEGVIHPKTDAEKPKTASQKKLADAKAKLAAIVKTAFVSHCKGHRNSKGELAEWCVKSHETGKIISSHTSEAAAKSHLQDMHAHSGSAKEAAAHASGCECGFCKNKGNLPGAEKKEDGEDKKDEKKDDKKEASAKRADYTAIDPNCPEAQKIGESNVWNAHIQQCPRCQEYNRQLAQSPEAVADGSAMGMVASKTAADHAEQAQIALQAIEDFFGIYNDEDDPKEDILRAARALEGSGNRFLEDIKKGLEVTGTMQDFGQALDGAEEARNKLEEFLGIGEGQGMMSETEEPADMVADEIARPIGGEGIVSSLKSRKEAAAREKDLRKKRSIQVQACPSNDFRSIFADYLRLAGDIAGDFAEAKSKLEGQTKTELSGSTAVPVVDPKELEKQAGSKKAYWNECPHCDYNPMGGSQRAGDFVTQDRVTDAVNRHIKTTHPEKYDVTSERPAPVGMARKADQSVAPDIANAKSKLDHGAKAQLADNSEATKTVDASEFAKAAGTLEDEAFWNKHTYEGENVGGAISKMIGQIMKAQEAFLKRKGFDSFELVPEDQQENLQSEWVVSPEYQNLMANKKRADQSVAPDIAEAKSELDHGAKAQLADNPDAVKTVDAMELEKQACHGLGDDLDEEVEMQVGFGDLADLGAGLPEVAGKVVDVPQHGEGGLNNEPKAKKEKEADNTDTGTEKSASKKTAASPEAMQLAQELIDRDDDLIYDVAANVGQIVDNIRHMQWFVEAVADELNDDDIHRWQRRRQRKMKTQPGV